MKPAHRDFPMIRNSLFRVFLTPSISLCALGSLACVPARADSASFAEAASMTVTFSNVPNVTLSVLQSQFQSKIIPVGDAGGSNNNSSFSFNNDTLTYSFSPIAGWASGASSNVLVAEDYFTQMSLTNSNAEPEQVQFTETISYAESAAVSGDGLVINDSSVSLEVYPFYMIAYCDDGPDCSSETIAMEPNGPATFQGPSFSPITVTGTLLIPANTTEFSDVGGADIVGYAYGSNPNPPPPPTPEPGTLTLFATGILGIFGAARRRAGGS